MSHKTKYRLRLPGMYPVMLLVITSVVGCYRGHLEMTAAETTAVKQAVTEALRSFEVDERNRDLDALITRLHPTFYMYQDGKRVDYSSVVSQMEATLPTLTSFEPSFEDVEVMVLAKDAAMVSMIFRDTIVDSTGKATQMWGPTTFLWKLTDETWKIAYADSDHYPMPNEGSPHGEQDPSE